jgi:hypothetical protein
VRIDHEGTLRLGWWKENEKMKHRPIAVEKPVDSKAAVALLGNSFDTKQGIIIEGTLRLPKAKDSPCCLPRQSEDSRTSTRQLGS